MKPTTPYHINRASILLAIRENKARTLQKICELFKKDIEPANCSTFLSNIKNILGMLENAGLITKIGEDYLPTDQLNNIQTALEISLNELSLHGKNSISVTPNLVFTQPTSMNIFSDTLKPIYDNNILTVAKEIGISVARADDFFTIGTIISDIWHAIYHARLIIADCTGRNPNVFYEIGMAHTLGKPTILIVQNLEDIPFDLRHLRVIEYKQTTSDLEIFKDKLKRTLILELNR
jgi:hypothetical protein